MGRPPRIPGQIRVTVAVVLSPALAADLRAEAARTGESVSVVAERWLEAGRRATAPSAP